MAFDLNTAYGFGDSTYDAITPYHIVYPTRITYYYAAYNVYEFDSYHLGEDEVMIHYCALKNTAVTDSSILAKLGTYHFVNLMVEYVDFWKYYRFDRTLDLDLDNFYVQAVKVDKFCNFTVKAEDPLTVPAFDSSNMCGGVRVIKCNGTFTMEAGATIDLKGKGLPASMTANRPLLPHELGLNDRHRLDADGGAGAENSITHDHLLLNVGDGAIMIIANQIVFGGDTCRIGNPDTNGVHYCRGATDSKNLPSGVTNVGGSTILLAANTIQGFNSNILAKYRTGTDSDENGKGLGRCYIACPYVGTGGNMIPHDEGLYSYDILSNSNNLVNNCHISNFGNGSVNWQFYTINGEGATVNRSARITARGSNYVVIDPNTINAGTGKNAAPNFEAGVLVMIHVTRTGTDNTNKIYNGRFHLSRITAVDGNTIYLDYQPTASNPNSTEIIQIITIPEWKNLTMNCTSLTCPQWENGSGGIFAVACSGTLDLRGKHIDVTGKGTSRTWQNWLEGNAFMNCRLPIGAGHGSVFLLAKEILMDNNTRIGGTNGGTGLMMYFGGTSQDGSCDSGGTGSVNNGGWHGNGGGAAAASDLGGRQGAHVFICANKITGFNLNAIVTGGERGNDAGYHNSAGYGGLGGGLNGGFGGYHGGGAGEGSSIGGGSAGGCFIYCNEYADADFSGIEIA